MQERTRSGVWTPTAKLSDVLACRTCPCEGLRDNRHKTLKPLSQDKQRNMLFQNKQIPVVCKTDGTQLLCPGEAGPFRVFIDTKLCKNVGNSKK